MGIIDRYKNKTKEEILQALVESETQREQLRATVDSYENGRQIAKYIDGLVKEEDYCIIDVLKDIFKLVLHRWSSSLLCGVRATLGKKEFTSENFKFSAVKLTEVISVENQDFGLIEFYYNEDTPPHERNRSMEQDRNLLNLIAFKIGKAATQLSRYRKFNLTFTSSPVAVCLLTLDDSLQFEEVNEVFIAQSGYPENELLGKKLSELDFFPNTKVLDEIKHRLHTSGLIKDYPLHVRLKNGEPKQLMLNAKKMPLLGGYKVIASFVDLTDLLSLKASEKESNDFNRLLIEALPLGLEIMDQNGKLLHGNQVLNDMFGDELEGKNCSNHHLPGHTPCYRCPLRRKMDVGETYTTDIQNDEGDRHLQVSHTGFLFRGKPALLNLYTDITQRKKAEQALQETNEKLNVIFENVDDAFIQVDLQGIITYVNPAAPRIYGFSSVEEMLGVDSKLLYANPDDADKIRKMMSEGQVIHDGTYQGKRKDGSLFWGSMNARYIHDENGNPKGKTGFIRDISHRQKIEQELRKAKEEAEQTAQQLDEAQELARFGSWQLNTVEGTATWSKELYKLLGMNPGERALPIAETAHFYTTESRKKIKATIEESLQTGTPYELELEMIRTDKQHFMARIHGRVMRNESGEIIGLQGTLQNIDRQKQLESEIIKAKETAEQNAEKLNEAQDLARVGSWHWIEETDKLYWSDASYKILQHDPKLPPPSSKDWEAYYPTKEQHLKVQTAFEKCLLHGTPYEMEIEMNRQDGTSFFVDVHGRPIKDKEGKIIGLQGTLQDINDKKLLEMDLIRAKEKAEESNRLKTAFLLNMSHEIRTPMNGILGLTSLLNDPDIAAEERDQFIHIINESGDRLLNTINDLLEISRIEIGDLNLNLTTADLHEVMKYQYSFFEIQTAEKGLQFEIGKQLTGNATQITTDPQKLDGILMNLIRNAVKYTNSGKIEIGNYREGDRLWFYVTDTGIGIPEDKLEAIFDRFIQADLGLSRGYEGSGIGLSIAKAYVEALGGQIEVESIYQKGSTFRFWIPYKQGGN